MSVEDASDGKLGAAVVASVFDIVSVWLDELGSGTGGGG